MPITEVKLQILTHESDDYDSAQSLTSGRISRAERLRDEFKTQAEISWDDSIGKQPGHVELKVRQAVHWVEEGQGRPVLTSDLIDKIHDRAVEIFSESIPVAEAS